MLRLKELRKSKKISQQQLADFIGVTQATLSGWENEKFEIDNKSLSECAKYFNASIDYLLGITNENFKSSDTIKGFKIPVLGEVQAGIPIEAIEDILDYEEISADMAIQGEYYGLQIKGHSMEPRMHPGDVVIVRQQSDVDSGDVAIVLVNGNDATCKKVVKHTDGINLVSYNSAFEPMFYSNKEIEEMPVNIIGKVVELRAKF